jgi:hypothetical protein
MIITNCFDLIINRQPILITSGQQRSKTDKTLKEYDHEIHQNFRRCRSFSDLFWFFAQSISASASTLDRAEAKIAAQAAEQGVLQNHQRAVQ